MEGLGLYLYFYSITGVSLPGGAARHCSHVPGPVGYCLWSPPDCPGGDNAALYFKYSDVARTVAMLRLGHRPSMARHCAVVRHGDVSAGCFSVIEGTQLYF